MFQKIPFKITLDFGSHANIFPHSLTLSVRYTSNGFADFLAFYKTNGCKGFRYKGIATNKTVRKVLLQNITLQRVSLLKFSITYKRHRYKRNRQQKVSVTKGIYLIRNLHFVVDTFCSDSDTFCCPADFFGLVFQNKNVPHGQKPALERRMTFH